jgi:hypothetical protein
MSGVKRWLYAEGQWLTDPVHVRFEHLPRWVAASDYNRDLSAVGKAFDEAEKALDAMEKERDTLAAENQMLREAVREFAGFFSSDSPMHWELHGLADGVEYGASKEVQS